MTLSTRLHAIESPLTLAEAYARTRARSARLFALLADEAYVSRPIRLRHPILFYEGHLPAFAINTLVRGLLGRPGLDDRLDALFARGIDPEDEAAADERGAFAWPTRHQIAAYVGEADALLARVVAEGPGHTDAGAWTEAVHMVLEHELMHQETLLYIWHRLPLDQKRRPDEARPVVDGPPVEPRAVRVPAGMATLGADPGEVPFAWDNERPRHRVRVPAFDLDVYDVTNEQFLAFVADGGYEREPLWSAEGWAWVQASGARSPLFWERQDDGWAWRGMFERVPLPATWPVFVTHAEAEAFTRWRGRRLMTEAEFQRAAYGTPEGTERRYPWGDADPAPHHGHFDFHGWDPHPVGAHPEGLSAWGIHDLLGNGWEWTATVFDGFPGFQAHPLYPGYSADFFDGQHYVMKGGSTATARELLRRSFRNWFRAQYPYVYATFRTAGDAA